MGWFKVDDQLAFHAKIVAAGNSAMGLWIRAGSWSSAQLTDGFIPTHMANAMANAMANPCDQDALVMAGLWDEVEGGYQFHDWSEFQPSAEEERQKRKARSLAGKKGAAARWDGKPHSKSHGKTDADAMANECDSDAPTRPDQTRPEEAKASSKRRAPEHPLPDSWRPSESHEEKAREKYLDVNLQAEAFRNHAATHDRRARNWNAAFSNWLIKATPGTPPQARNVPTHYGWANQ